MLYLSIFHGVGCPDNNGGVCIPEGKTWYNKTECVRYTCTKVKRRRFIMELKTSDHSMSYSLNKFAKWKLEI